MAARDRVGREDGLLLCPEGAATYVAWENALAEGLVSKDDRIVLFNTATGLKYPLPEVTERIDQNLPFDASRFK